MELRHLMGVVRHWWWLLGASFLVAGGAAYVISSALPKIFEAEATLIVGQSIQATNPDLNQLLASQRLSQTYAELATTTPLLERVIATNNLVVTPDELAEHVEAVAPRDSTLVHLTVSDSDPQRAASIANSLAQEMIAASPAAAGRNVESQQFIDASLQATQAQIEDTQAEIEQLMGIASPGPDAEQRLEALQGRIVTLRQTYATLLGFSSNSGANLLTVVDPAAPPEDAASPAVLLNTVLAGIGGLLLALGALLLVDYLDDTVKSDEDVQSVARLATLGVIGEMNSAKGPASRLVTLIHPSDPIAEAYRTLRTNVEFATVDTPIQTLLVTSSLPLEGKTTTAANLAVVFAQTGRHTILLDANFRKPGVHRILGLPNDVGLSDLMRSDGTAVTDVAQTTKQANLVVITSGSLPRNPAEVLGSQRMRVILERLTEVGDLVVIDSPPLQAVTDAAILASMTDGTLFVIAAGRSRRGAVRSGLEAVAKADAHALGVVLNRAPERTTGQRDYREYQRGYGSPGRKG